MITPLGYKRSAKTMQLPYKNRAEAARELAKLLTPYAGRADVLVLGLPRGGVPVAYEVAQRLTAALDLMLVRKLGLPGHEELAMGAIATGGIRVLNADVVEGLGVPAAVIERVTAAELQELQRREHAYRGTRPIPNLAGRWVILVDDGLATGATMRAAIAAVRQQQPARLVVAVPVAPPATIAALRKEVDDVVCPAMPEPMFGISQWYEDFAQVTDEEVRALLQRAWQNQPGGAAPADEPPGRAPHRCHTKTIERTAVTVQTAEVALAGYLVIPEAAAAIIVFAHGSGSSRQSPRNRFVADTLNAAGFATLLFDLLTPQEERLDVQTRELRFNIGLLAARLTETVDWLGAQSPTQALRIGLFGASTGAAAALMTAAQRPHTVGAVVSRGGRPDLAGDALPRVKAPTLLIVGGADAPVITLNRTASQALHTEHRLEIVPGATHLFVEPGALDKVAQLACDWFRHYLLTDDPYTGHFVRSDMR
jgi:putative phosphoribosyl transferase